MAAFTEEEFSIAVSDPDGDRLDFSWTLDGKPVFHCAEPSFTYAPAAADSGLRQLAVAVFDGRTTVSYTWQITVTGEGAVTVDNLDANTSRTGTWTVSSAPGYWGSNSVYSDSGGTFTWTPSLPISGSYEVYAWWTYHANRSTTVPYRIAHNGGTATVTVNQRDPALAGRWNRLGTYTFTQGVNGQVTVSSQNGQANADAVRFIKQEAVTVGPATFTDE